MDYAPMVLYWLEDILISKIFCKSHCSKANDTFLDLKSNIFAVLNKENATISSIIIWKEIFLTSYYIFAAVDQRYNLKNDTVTL